MSNSHATDPDKHYYATEYHCQREVNCNNYFLYGLMKGYGITSAFEFGCNAGRHLKMLQKYGFRVAGIDVNKRAIGEAQKAGLECEIGDEEALKKIDSASYDACLTVSVLSHIREVNEILDDLERIAKRYVILCETEQKKKASRHWYSHDYCKMGYDCLVQYYAPKLSCFYGVYVKEL